MCVCTFHIGVFELSRPQLSFVAVVQRVSLERHNGCPMEASQGCTVLGSGSECRWPLMNKA